MTEVKNRKACPICGKPTDERFKPFCSKRCADVDLHRWFSGSYAIPVTEDEEEDERRDDSGDAPN
jgi:uncharacterized protein